MTIRCEIVSQDRTVFAGDVDIVVLPGAAGEMGILPKHAPVLTTLKYGIIKVSIGGKEEVFTENVEEIDVACADSARVRAEEALKNAPTDTDAYLAMEAALRKSNLRLDAARRYRKNARSPYSEQ